jgi:hypothetical protein
LPIILALLDINEINFAFLNFNFKNFTLLNLILISAMVIRINSFLFLYLSGIFFSTGIYLLLEK